MYTFKMQTQLLVHRTPSSQYEITKLLQRMEANCRVCADIKRSSCKSKFRYLKSVSLSLVGKSQCFK